MLITRWWTSYGPCSYKKRVILLCLLSAVVAFYTSLYCIVNGHALPQPQMKCITESSSVYNEAKNTSPTTQTDEHINTQAFLLLIFYGVFITGIVAMLLLMFQLLPLVSQELITYIFELVQLIVVLISTQFAYKLLFTSSFSFENIVKKFKDVYSEKGSNKSLVSVAQKKEDLDDVAGEFAAELTAVIIDKMCTL